MVSTITRCPCLNSSIKILLNECWKCIEQNLFDRMLWCQHWYKYISNECLERTANTLKQIISNNSLKREFKDYLWSINLRFFDEIRKETKNEEMVRMQSNNHVSKTIKRSSIPTIITMNPQKVILMQLLSWCSTIHWI